MTSKKNILVVDDTPETREVVQRNLEAVGYNVFLASNVPDAISILKSDNISLVITDLKMPKVCGLELVKHVRDHHENIGVIVITGYASIEGAVNTVKLGAEEYLAKPFTDAELLDAVERTATKIQMRNIGKFGIESSGVEKFGILGSSKAMQEVFANIRKASESSATVLISGESGTGKELIARAIHYNSSRNHGPFVSVNCGGIPENLYESELFGHFKGAFTGATESRAGFFQTADSGSIFLDEISETPPSLQVKLLRVLQEKEITMVGHARAQKVDVRIIVATNKDLHRLMKSGKFRDDLFYRINVITIEAPPLRERGDDVLMLARYFMKKYSSELGRSLQDLSDRVLEILMGYSWPGNVRELENLIHRCVVMAEKDVIEASDLPSHMRFSTPGFYSINQSLADVEAEHISRVLSSVQGNVTKAAKILGIDRKTLRAKAKTTPLESTAGQS